MSFSLDIGQEDWVSCAPLDEEDAHRRLGSSDVTWWCTHDEYRFIECFMVACLIVLAIIFENAHELLEHSVVHKHPIVQQQPTGIVDGHRKSKRNSHGGRRHSGSYGQNGSSLAYHSQSPKQSAGPLDLESKQPRLTSNLFIRSANELSVLGFIAFFIWTVRTAGAFEAIAKHLPASDEAGWRLPNTAPDLIHMLEDVHMHLFIAMLTFYSLLIHTTNAADKLFDSWHQMEEDVKAVEDGNESKLKHLREYAWFSHLRTKTFSYLAAHMEAESSEQKEILDDFNFAIYLQVNVRLILEDLIQINSRTWFGVLCVTLAIFAPLSRLGKNLYQVFAGVILGGHVVTCLMMLQRKLRMVRDCRNLSRVHTADTAEVLSMYTHDHHLQVTPRKDDGVQELSENGGGGKVQLANGITSQPPHIVEPPPMLDLPEPPPELVWPHSPHVVVSRANSREQRRDGECEKSMETQAPGLMDSHDGSRGLMESGESRLMESGESRLMMSGDSRFMASGEMDRSAEGPSPPPPQVETPKRPPSFDEAGFPPRLPEIDTTTESSHSDRKISISGKPAKPAKPPGLKRTQTSMEVLQAATALPQQAAQIVDASFNTELFFLRTLQTLLLITSYGIAQTVGSGWYWSRRPIIPVSALFFFLVFKLFIWYASKHIIPWYLAIMAAPPNMDPENVKIAEDVIRSIRHLHRNDGPVRSSKKRITGKLQWNVFQAGQGGIGRHASAQSLD